MVYSDKDYEVDVDNKLDYTQLQTANASDIEDHVFNYSAAYEMGDAYLIEGTDDFYVKNVQYCKEIRNHWYKVVL